MKRFNLDQLLWFCILMVLSIILTNMLFTGKMFLLIDGERIFSTSIMLIILYLFTVVQAMRIFTVPSRAGIKKGYFQYLILIIILILVSNIDIPKTSILMKGVRLAHAEHNHGEKHDHIHTELASEGTITINDKNFHDAIEEITAHKDKYINRKIKIEGIYYIDKKYSNNFIITQLNMNCCIADSEYLGILCKKSGLENVDLEIGDKIKVTGILKEDEYEEEKFMDIDVLEIKKCK